ncbi:MAG: 4-hydroxy-tetrahydrodipicolinate synthase [Bacteroidales bacterium]|nr:4-hydroxy-tetrahydrodipicolinate synthase [Bacteroidales bacterium]
MLLKGCGTALVTPFHNGEVDYTAYAALIDRQVSQGVDFLVPLATTGETPTLSSDEKVELLKITRSHSAGRPLLVGCGSNSVPGTLANMALLEPYGVDAWLVVVPFYNKPTQEGQYLYFKTIAEHSTKPIVIYNVPGRTGANMTAETCWRIAEDCPNVIAIKEASGKLEQVYQILENAPEGFAVLSGDDDLTLEMMRHGAHGVISVASNAAPALVAQMASAALEGNFDAAAATDEKLQALFKNCFVESNPIPVKAAMALMGLMESGVRLPLSNATPSTVQIMQKTLKDLNLI